MNVLVYGSMGGDAAPATSLLSSTNISPPDDPPSPPVAPDAGRPTFIKLGAYVSVGSPPV